MLSVAGGLDSTFDVDGFLTTNITGGLDYGRGMAIQADGKIVVVGYGGGAGDYDFVVVRHNTDGSLDTSFDEDGIVRTDFGASDDRATCVAIQADGKIVVAGYVDGDDDFIVARYNTDGSLDTSFDGDGKLSTDFGSEKDRAYGVAIQADGKIVVVGETDGAGGSDFAVARYYADGTLDSSLDGDGKLTTDFDSAKDRAYGVAIQADGKIVAVGYSYGDSGDFAVARYNTDGTLDASLGGDGKLTTDFGSYEYASGVAIQADGKIVVVGQSRGSESRYDFAVARYNTNGSVDTSFSDDGKLTTDFGLLVDDYASGVAIQADGGIVVAGYSGAGFAVARYAADGSLDTSWDGDGMLTTEFGAYACAYSVAIQADGKIVVAGIGYSDSVDLAVARYNTDGSLDTSLDGDGKVTAGLGSYDSANGVAVQADGKIVVVGYCDGDFGVARYNTDGSLDTSFADDGKLTTNFGSNDCANAVAIQADGKTVVAGYSGASFAVARYNTDGSLDTSFAEDGTLTTNISPLADLAYCVAIQTDGKIVVAGSSGGDFALARYNTDGSLDTSLDGDGMLITDINSSSDDRANGVVVQGDGRIVAVGYSEGDFAVARYHANGSLDASLDGDGKLTTDFNSATDLAYAVAIQTDGKLVVAGYSDGDFAVARYGTDGSLDTSLDGDGMLTADFGSSTDVARSVSIQADDKIVVAGLSGYRFAVVRYRADGSLDTSLDGDGMLTADFGSTTDLAYNVAVQADGKFVAVGASYTGETVDFAVARYQKIDFLAGDYDENSIVDEADYGLWKSSYGQAVTPGTGADGSGDGVVDAADYTVWRDNFGRVNASPEVAGDYDRNGTVDGADYALWKRLYGRAGDGWAADGNGDGIVDAADYTVWRDNLGATAAVGASVQVGSDVVAEVVSSAAVADPLVEVGQELKVVTAVVDATVGEGGLPIDKAPSPRHGKSPVATCPLSATADLRPKGEGFGVRAEPQSDGARFADPGQSPTVYGDVAVPTKYRDLALLRLSETRANGHDPEAPAWRHRHGETEDYQCVDAALADAFTTSVFGGLRTRWSAGL